MDDLPAGTTAGPPPALAVRDVAVHFGGVKALEGVSLDVGNAQIVGLIGPNGSGKTTLFDTISGLTRPTRGQLTFGGADVTARSAVWRARWGLRRTFQRQQVFGRLSVEDNLLAAIDWRGGAGGMAGDLFHLRPRARAERRHRAATAEIMELCGLSGVRDRPSASLPIGAARMLELGRALVAKPKILLLDEPTSGLGDAETENLAAALAAFRAAGECAILLVEHDVNFVMTQSSYVHVLVGGQVLTSGTPRQIQEHPDVIAAYLG